MGGKFADFNSHDLLAGLKSVAGRTREFPTTKRTGRESRDALIESQERDVTELATLEDRLSESLDSDGYLLKYFISATSMAFASASASATAAVKTSNIVGLLQRSNRVGETSDA